MSQAQDTGKRGEAAALRLAQERGWSAGRTNVRVGRFEADVVCFRAETGGRAGLLLEVKASRGRMPAPERVSARQQQRLWRMAETLAIRHDLARVDVAVVLVTLRDHSEQAVWLELEPF